MSKSVLADNKQLEGLQLKLEDSLTMCEGSARES